MKAFIEGPVVRSGSVRRINQQLTRYALASDVIITPKASEADFVIIHAIGRQDQVATNVRNILRRGQRYAVIQYCLRSTKRPHTSGWAPIWKGAAVVWSFLNLTAAVIEDGAGDPSAVSFYHTPLGADASVFRYATGSRPYLVCTSGQSDLTESVREVCVAAARVGGKVFHLGPYLRSLGSHVTCAEGMDDLALADLYGQCQFVSGLRRVEGFEMPAAEALLCGAKPILFERTHYRDWYGPWGIFIPENSREEVAHAVEAVFRRPWAAITVAERNAAAERFDWERLVKGFWARCQ